MVFATQLHNMLCPYCGEPIEILLDLSEAEQEFIEDCQVCCRPIQFSVSVDEVGEPQVRAISENDTW